MLSIGSSFYLLIPPITFDNNDNLAWITFDSNDNLDCKVLNVEMYLKNGVGT